MAQMQAREQQVCRRGGLRSRHRLDVHPAERGRNLGLAPSERGCEVIALLLEAVASGI